MTEAMWAFRRAVAALIVCAALPAYPAKTHIHVERGSYTGPLEVRVGVPREDAEPKWVEVKRLRLPNQSVVEMDSLSAGTYVVLLAGEAPFERFAVQAGIRGEAGEIVRVAVPQARRVRGTIRLGSASAGDAVLTFRHRHFGWSTSFSARPDGTFESPLWQDGEFVLIARGGGLSSLVRRPVRIQGPYVEVDLSPLRITGIVTDDDGAPIPEAMVSLRAEAGRETVTVKLTTDAHGIFELADVKPGPYIINVAAEGYLIAADHRVFVTGEKPVERAGITMSTGIARSLRVVDASGRPVANAAVNIVSDGKLRSRTATDAEGRATVAVPAPGSATAWVLPPNGSFAVVRLEPRDAAKDPKKVLVPPPSASVVIEVRHPDQSGVPGLALLMRYNGHFLLPNASAAFGLRTDEKGRARLARVPPGLYEFWPFASREEAAALIEAQAFSPAPAPITIEAAEGDSRATVVVEKQEIKRGVVQ